MVAARQQVWQEMIAQMQLPDWDDVIDIHET